MARGARSIHVPPPCPRGSGLVGRDPQLEGDGHRRCGGDIGARVCPGHSHPPLLLPGLYLPRHLQLNLLNLILRWALLSVYFVPFHPKTLIRRGLPYHRALRMRLRDALTRGGKVLLLAFLCRGCLCCLRRLAQGKPLAPRPLGRVEPRASGQCWGLVMWGGEEYGTNVPLPRLCV